MIHALEMSKLRLTKTVYITLTSDFSCGWGEGTRMWMGAGRNQKNLKLQVFFYSENGRVYP